MYAPVSDMNYERNLLNYAAVYAGSIFREYPLNRRTRRVLRQLQHGADLQNEDVSALEARVCEYKAYLEVLSQDREKDSLQLALRQIVVGVLRSPHDTAPPSPEPQEPSSSPRSPLWLQTSVYTAAGLLFLVAIATSLYWLLNPAATSSPSVEPASSPTIPPTPVSPVDLSPAPVQPSPSVSPTLAVGENALRDRCTQLRVDYEFLLRLSNHALIRATNATTAPEAVTSSAQNASRLLDQLEKALDKTILPNLGHYTQEQARQQRQRISELAQSEKTIDKEADRRFQALFPQWKQGDNIQGTGLDQVWLALVDEILKERQVSQLEGRR